MMDWYVKYAGAVCAFSSITSDKFPSNKPNKVVIDAFVEQFELDNKRKPTDDEISKFKQSYILTVEISNLTKQ